MDDNTKKNSILIVDDEKMNLKSLTHILTPDYTVYTAKDGPTAIEMAEQYLPDLILLDILMPGMDGYEVLAALKTIEATREIPIIIISGLNSAADEEKALALGTRDYISKPFSAGTVKLRIRNQIQIVNQIRAIERLSMMDQLTDIPNRRNFDNQLRTEWRRAIREQSPISIMMIDVDRFKYYNDTYGHLQGDVVLQTIAKVISQTLRRTTDFFARWGGEEFVVLLSNTEADGAMEVAKQIHENIGNKEIPCTDGSITKITISVGVNTQLPTQDSSADIFFSRADRALYIAKELGRNKVYQYEEIPAE
ncbi:MAG: diguanylate cyclase [Treponema sp.]|jgi:diguanylate cyclase (GGDEF)-like protein|nr:diguanylate cyclase [Treponema sp.]